MNPLLRFAPVLRLISGVLFAAAGFAQGVDQNLLARLLQQYRSEPKAFEFAMVGDHPYGPEGLRKWPAMMASINRSGAAFVTHNGDFKNGSSVCSDAVFENRLELFSASEHPFIFTPGDNDWTDCHRTNNGPFDPLERLARIRQMFHGTNQSLGRRKMHLTLQSEDARFGLYRENALWTMGNVVFATVHVIGSNNNWGRTAEQNVEYTARNRANLHWISTAFALARDGNFDGVVITMQADMLFQLARTNYERLGFNDTHFVLAQEAAAFRKPVLLVNSDTHIFQMDKPLPGAISGRRMENVTRVQNFSDLDVHWLRVKVDPASPNLFQVEQVIVPENVVVR